MVCDRVSQRSFSQTILFAGYMVGSLVFGVLSDKYVDRRICSRVADVQSVCSALADDPSWAFRSSSSLSLASSAHSPRRRNSASRSVMDFLSSDGS